jgi:hypothetical protein
MNKNTKLNYYRVEETLRINLKGGIGLAAKDINAITSK